MAEGFLLVGGTVVSEGRVLPRATVQVVGDRIVDVSQSAAASDSRVIDITGLLLIPGLVNAHAHGLTTGPLFSSAATPLTVAEAVANANRHLAAGVTTAINVCGFAIEVDRIDHPMRIELGTTNLPHARTAAMLVDGSALTERRRERTAELMLAAGARAIGEVGSGATLGGGVAAYRYLPDAVLTSTGVRLDPATATELIDALVGPLRTGKPDDGALHEAMERLSVPPTVFQPVRKAILGLAAAPVVASLSSFAEAAELSADTGIPAVFHTAEPSVRELIRLARHTQGRLVAGHMNHPSMAADDAVEHAMILRELGVVIDVSSLDIVHAQSMCSPVVADALASAGVVDTLTTDYAGGNWEPMLALVQRWIGLGLVDLARGIMMCTSTPAQVFGFSDRGRIAAGLLADLVVCNPANLEDVRAVFVGGQPVTIRPGA